MNVAAHSPLTTFFHWHHRPTSSSVTINVLTSFSRCIILARDKEIQDPTILAQIIAK